MHCLNLSASKAITIPDIRHAQDIVQGACSFFKSSAKRIDVLKCTIQELADSRTSKTNLTSLCTTRFIERHTAVVTFRCLLRYILVALDKISTWQSSEARKDALALKNSITRSEFVVSLVILENISGLMLPTTRSLQKVGSDFVQAMHDIGDMISSLQSLRTQGGFHKLFQEAYLASLKLFWTAT